MKKILIFLLISAIASTFIEEPNELDDVSLEFDPFKDIGDAISDAIDDTKRNIENLTDEVKSILKKLEGKNPFAEIKGHIKELEAAMKQILPIKQIQKNFVGKPLEIFKKQTRQAQNAIYWLKVNGYWDLIMDVVKKVGKVAAISLCSAFLTPVICTPVITFVFEAYVKNL